MTADEFNEKWKAYLEEGHYGLAIDVPPVVEYLDNQFEIFSKVPGFRYSQIKTKFGMSRFYAEKVSTGEVEKRIDKILKEWESRVG